jgi:hypothetical protein
LKFFAPAGTKRRNRRPKLAALVTTIGFAPVIALAGIWILLVRRSARVRDHDEATLRDSNINLEASGTHP